MQDLGRIGQRHSRALTDRLRDSKAPTANAHPFKTPPLARRSGNPSSEGALLPVHGGGVRRDDAKWRARAPGRGEGDEGQNKSYTHFPPRAPWPAAAQAFSFSLGRCTPAHEAFHWLS